MFSFLIASTKTCDQWLFTWNPSPRQSSKFSSINICYWPTRFDFMKGWGTSGVKSVFNAYKPCSIADGCNVASFVHYYGISLCLLAMCEPLSLCTMKTYPGATSAILTSGNDTVFTSNDSDMLNVSVTDNTSPPTDDKVTSTKMPPMSTSGAESSTVISQPMVSC